jgi:hypothetical protein
VRTVYLDTNVISGLAKGEYPDAVAMAFIEVTAFAKREVLELYTSEIAAEELQQIPMAFRRQHLVIYNLIKNIALMRESGHATLVAMGLGGGNIVTMGLGRPPAPKLIRDLNSLIPTTRNPAKARARERDISHLYQCQMAGLDYFLTEDRRSILRHKLALLALGINVVSSRELIAEVQ